MTAPVPAPTPGQGPGWYPDPWGAAPWRWWDGAAWTPHVRPVTATSATAATAATTVASTTSAVASAAPATSAARRTRRPRLPRWLSVPVLVAGICNLPFVAITVAMAPVVLLLALVPLLFVLPTLSWLDRVEPEPRSSRLHALLWGATVAALISGIVNSLVAVASSDAIAAVVSAPLIEESTKGLGVLWAVRRREVDGVMDGIVYAGWVGLGFAFVENFQYFLTANDDGSLAGTFVLRALLTPFAHPLFTAWIGLAVGLAVARGRRPFPSALWGFALAAGTHAAWNGSLTLAGEDGGAVLGIAALAFVGLFVAAIVTVVRVRAAERRRFVALVPMLAARYGIAAEHLAPFTDWRRLLATRKALPRARRRRFDAVHAALARLAALHGRRSPIDPIDEQVLVGQLRQAWEQAHAT